LIKKLVKFFILLAAVIVLSFSYVNRRLLFGIYHNNKSIDKLSQKMNFEALNEMIEALRHQSLSPEFHINLGIIYLTNKDFDRAEKEFLTASRLSSLRPEIKFIALFNAGIAATQLKKVDEALASYQDALEIKKDSLETKTNIELLTQSQKGGGEGEGEGKPDPKKDGQGDKDKNDPNRKAQNERPKNQPEPYKGKEISKENVKKILEELKQQEQQVRAKFENKNNHTSPNEKDW
jgi:tetratricopeptide (TPR) repeat protein